MSVIDWLKSLRPAIPMSAEKPCIEMSNGEIARHLKNGAILINGAKMLPNDALPEQILSLVFFPKSEKRRTTIF